MNKKISVIMGVYNCAQTLREAVASIQAQTYTNWTMIICDDGSTDNTYSVAIQLAQEDVRITVIKNEQNQGLNATLNRCLEYADGEYIARMDGDDKCTPDRFDKQMAYLDAHPEVGIVSNGMLFFDETGVWGQTTPRVTNPTARHVVLGSPICHAPAMLRAECYKSVEGYSDKKYTTRVEDVDLWIRLYAKGYQCHNLEELLYLMRNNQNAFQRRKYRYRINSVCVRLKGCKLLHLNLICYIKAFRPMMVGLVPTKLRVMHRKRKNKMKGRT